MHDTALDTLCAVAQAPFPLVPSGVTAEGLRTARSIAFATRLEEGIPDVPALIAADPRWEGILPPLAVQLRADTEACLLACAPALDALEAHRALAAQVRRSLAVRYCLVGCKDRSRGASTAALLHHVPVSVAEL